MAMTTPTEMAYRTAAPPDKTEEPVVEALVAVVRPAVAGLAEVLAEACPRVVVASTLSGEHPSVALAEPCTRSWFILASGIW